MREDELDCSAYFTVYGSLEKMSKQVLGVFLQKTHRSYKVNFEGHMSLPIKRSEDIGSAYAEKLIVARIKTTDDLRQKLVQLWV